MAKNITKSDCCTPSVTSVTKRNKRNKSNLDKQRNNVTSLPVGEMLCYACPGAVQKGPLPVMILKQEVPESELKKLLVQTIRELRALRSEVNAYLDGYTSQGMRSKGKALAKLRKAAERAAKP